MQFAAHCANQFRQPAFVGGVNIFVTWLDDKLTPPPLIGHLFQAGDDLFRFSVGQDTGARQPSCIGLATLQIDGPKALIKANGGVKLFHQRVGLAGKTTAPEFIRHVLLLVRVE